MEINQTIFVKSVVWNIILIAFHVVLLDVWYAKIRILISVKGDCVTECPLGYYADSKLHECTECNINFDYNC